MDIKKLIKAGETDTVEFKTSFGKEVIISLSAFANTAGGKVLVGVDDAGKPVGITAGPEMAEGISWAVLPFQRDRRFFSD